MYFWVTSIAHYFYCQLGQSDQNIWIEIKKGNKRAFELLYKSLYPSLCLYAYSIIPDEEFVKEIVNDVFLKVWDKRDTIDIKYGIKPYLYRCVYNSCVDNRKKLRKLSHIKAEDHPLLKIEDIVGQDSEYIIDKISYSDLEKDVTKGINTLPDRCKEIFMLSRFDMLSYLEIAEKLNISVNTVKTQMSRAMDRLRVELAKYIKPGL